MEPDTEVKRKRGRPKGSVGKRQEQIRAAINLAMPDVIDRIVEAAQNGDIAAATALLDRTVPKVRPVSVAVLIDLDGSAEEIGKRILTAVGRGEVPADVGLELIELAQAARQGAPEAITPLDTEALDRVYTAALEQARERQEAIRLERQGLYDGIETGDIPT